MVCFFQTDMRRLAVEVHVVPVRRPADLKRQFDTGNWSAGEVTGVAGAKVAMLEGTVAGLEAASEHQLMSADAVRRRSAALAPALRTARTAGSS